ncbi:uncharacterized protein BJ171DRAFT_599351 [Polychytrium aggregatum]|uniref:uncharacterized protein n=1 Tax=Polychytrium aggregatum TaxID=110093 RepID=UPI0022FDDEA5|nr:uncharacterized protein BJ171DRAFT_599351 [Polychytrium aggregatum]KAI9204168.1 hypothetical protein BJ171DRAFT_599351 [Polychytrium aggregatum]
MPLNQPGVLDPAESPDASAVAEADGTLEVWIQTVKKGLFGVLFIVNKNDHKESPIWIISETILDHFQDLGFPLLCVLFPWQPEIQWLQTFLGWFSPESLIAQSDIILYILMIVLLLIIINTIFVAYSFSRNQFRYFWTLKILRVTLGLLANVLHIPTLSKFILAMVYCPETLSISDGTPRNMINCWSPTHLPLSIVAAVLLTFFMLLITAVKATFFDPDPNEKNMLCRPHSRVELLYLGCRTVLTVLNIILAEGYGETSYPYSSPTVLTWVFAAACACCSCLLAFCYIWYIPFYNFGYACFRACTMLNFAWASLCAIYTIVRPDSDVGIFYVATIPLVSVFAILAVRSRRRYIEGKYYSDINSPWVMELHIRFKLERAGLLYKGMGKAGALRNDESPGDLSYQPTVSDDTQAPPTASKANVSSEEGNPQKVVIMEITEIISFALKQFQESCFLQLLAGQFYLLQLGNRSQCLASLGRAEHLDRDIDEEFLIYRRQRLLNEKFSGGDVIDFIACEQNLRFAKRFERRATIAIAQFWRELLKKHPGIQKLQNKGSDINSAITSAQQYYLSVLKLSPKSSNVYRLYGKFLTEIMNDHREGQRYLDKAEEMDTANPESRDGGERFDALDLFDEKVAHVTISGDREDLGIIQNVNSTVSKLLGFHKSEVLNHNVKIIIPSPFAEMHDMLLQRYLDTGFAKVIDRKRHVLAIRKDGYLLPIDLCVKQLTTSGGGISFIGLMRAAERPDEEEFIILSDSLQLIHFTQGMSQYFSVSPSELSRNASAGFTIIDYFPGIKKEQVIDGGREVLVTLPDDSSEGHYDLCFQFTHFVMGSAGCYIVRFAKVIADRTSRSKRGSIVECPFSARRRSEAPESFPMSFSPEGSSNQLSAQKSAELGPGSDRLRSSSVSSSRTGIGGSSYAIRLISKKNKASEAKLRHLAFWFIVCLMMVFTVTVTDIMLYRLEITQRLNNLNYVSATGSAMVSSASIADTVRTIELIEKGIVTFESISDKAVFRSRLLNLISVINTDALLIPTGSAITLISTPGSSISTGQLTFVDGINRFLTVCRILQSSNPLYTDQADIQAVLQNAIGPIITALDSSTDLYLDSSENSSGVLRALVAPLLCVVVYCFFMGPIFARINDSKEDFLKMFLDIPKETVKAIYESHKQRLAEDSDNEGEEDIFEFENDIEQLESELRSSVASSVMRRKNASLVDSWKSWIISFFRGQRTPLIRMGVMTTICLVYFFIVSGVFYAYMSSNSGVTVTIHQKYVRFMLMRRVTFALREAFLSATGQNVTVVAQQVASIIQSLDLYETQVMATASNLLPSSYEYDLTYLDACVPGSLAGCDQYAFSLLSNGLATSVYWYIDSAYQALQSIQTIGLSGTYTQLVQLMMLLRSLDYSYLQYTINQAVISHYQPFIDWTQWFETFHITVASIFVAVMLLYYWRIINPMFSFMSEETKRAHIMLLMIPPDILAKIDSIQAWANENNASKGILRKLSSIISVEKMVPPPAPSSAPPALDAGMLKKNVSFFHPDEEDGIDLA